eukprot:11211605-Lingulodinium_polyedra.AAC.1
MKRGPNCIVKRLCAPNCSGTRSQMHSVATTLRAAQRARSPHATMEHARWLARNVAIVNARAQTR